MGKVRDEAPARSSKPAPKGSAVQDARRKVVPFVVNLLRGDPYKPSQGWYARLWTAVGMGLLVAAGLYQLYVTVLKDTYSQVTAISVVAVLGAVLGWIVYRIVQYAPFADFLIATEAEMNKVSWTGRDELKRATIVVVVTVFVMAVFLFGVDWLWSNLLQALGILRFQSGDFGSQAG